MSNKIIIAIDGYSSSGKSTMAKELARTIGYRYVDSGAMYRAVTLYAMRHGLIDEEGNVKLAQLEQSLNNINIDFMVDNGRQSTLLNGENVENEIRQLPVSNKVSIIAAIPAVRHRLVSMQQQCGKDRGIVMDGRDIGTTVFPDAELKIFVNAPAETRAQRRLKELQDKGTDVSYEDILENVRTRDHIDETREESPLRRAADAIDFDNSTMSIDEQNNRLLEIYNQRIKS
ncbi:MAG: (d)CMP kinase [Clostridiales bacterium]|nr:(d)CMP kinase [Clostridiales bacterium]